MKKHIIYVSLLLLTGFSSAQAASSLQFNCTKANFSNTATSQIQNDTLTMSFFIEEQGTNLETIQRKNMAQLNETMKNLKIKGLEVGLLGQQVYPTYNQNGRVISQWNYRSNFYVKSTDFSLINAALPDLLKLYKIENTTYSASTKLRASVMEDLKKSALKAVLQDAQRTADLIGVQKISVQEFNFSPEFSEIMPSPMVRMSAMAEKATMVSADSAGDSLVRYTVSSTVGFNCREKD